VPGKGRRYVPEGSEHAAAGEAEGGDEPGVGATKTAADDPATDGDGDKIWGIDRLWFIVGAAAVVVCVLVAAALIVRSRRSRSREAIAEEEPNPAQGEILPGSYVPGFSIPTAAAPGHLEKSDSVKSGDSASDSKRPQTMVESSLVTTDTGDVAAVVTTKGDDRAIIREEVNQLVEETCAPGSADVLMEIYGGREKELVKQLRR